MGNDRGQVLTLEYRGFDLLVFRLFRQVIAFRLRGQPPVLAANPLRFEERDADEFERHLGLLDWGAPSAPSARRDYDAFIDAMVIANEGVPPLFKSTGRPVDAHGRASGVAALLERTAGGFALYEADSPHDTLPDDQVLGPLGRAGYWGGSPSRLVWIGETRMDVLLAKHVVHFADLARWGCTVTSDAILPPPPDARRPIGPPPNPIDELLAAREAGESWPPGGELRAMVGGRWSGSVAVPCALCGATTDLARFGRGHLHLCLHCRPYAEVGRRASQERHAHSLLAADPATMSPDDRGDPATMAAVLKWLDR